MFRMQTLATLAGALLLATAAGAQEPIRFARTPDISPDAKLVAFSYLGDIWVVETIGGIARPVTMHEAHDVYPAFSPDGRMIAFSSNRHGSYNVFVVSVQGGHPRRLTFDSANDYVNGWSPDGKRILFTSSRGTDFPPSLDLYTVPVEGGRVRRVTFAEGKEGAFSPTGDRIAYVRGPGSWYRKGYRGSANDDVWICNADGTNHRQLTRFSGEDASPMWAPDGETVYYVSECLGTPDNPVPANIVRQDAAGRTPPQAVTTHKEDAVRRARISADGRWIVYECGPDVWVASARGDMPPRRLAIEVHADDKANTERTVTFTRGVSEYALSPDETHVAFAVHGELFLVPISGGKATRLTDNPAYDHGLAWSPDGRQILFISDRGGYEDVYALESDDPEHRLVARAHQFKVRQLTDTPEPEVGLSFAPDGRRVAFLRAGRLWTMRPDGSEQKVIVDDPQVFDYEWSPDGRWFAYARLDGSFASELYLIPSTGAPGGKGRNVTRYATFNGGVTWSVRGSKLAFISQRRSRPSVYVLSLEKPAAPGAPASGDIDWEDLHLRAEQAAPLPAEEAAISPDGTKVAFRASALGDDLWVVGTDGSQLTRVTQGSIGPQDIRWSKRVPDGIYFRDSQGQIRAARLGGGDPHTVSFKAKMTVRRDEEFAEMFEQSWRALSEQFYDPKFHGVNWTAVREKYRPVVHHLALKEDLYTLINLMVGELNASHLGITGPTPAPEEVTADLGLLFDEAYRGPGLRVAEVLRRGPADRRGLNLRPGDYIRAVDGTELTDRVSLSRLLNDKVGEPVVLSVASDPTAAAKTWRRVEVHAAERSQVAELMYERWVERNAERVARRSKGRLGYIHIPSMDDAGVDRFLRALYSDNFDKEAIVLDVRYNGGGFSHEQLLNYLGGREHTFFRSRYGGEGLVLRSYDRKWTRPLVLLINNRSYSDAEIFPSAFRTMGMGRLVGQPTGGYVIGTSSVRLIDGSLFRVPRTGVFTVKGVNMEKAGVTPDVLVEQNPDQIARGDDPQVDRAVDVLLADVDTWKKTHPDLAHQGAGERHPATAAAPMPVSK